MDIHELLSGIDPESFINYVIDDIFLIINYVDQTGLSTWKGQNEIELGFFLNLD